MKVTFVSVTAWNDKSAEDLIVYCARVSSPANQENTATSSRLIKYLIEHKHWSPFEMVDMTVEIETSRAIAAQILRHRSFSFQEFSQRYSSSVMGFETYAARRQDTKNRQNSFNDLSSVDLTWFEKTQQAQHSQTMANYLAALDRGIAKESARFLLPLTVKTRLYMKGSVRSWLHYIQVRTDDSAQKEHRDIAFAIAHVFAKQFPLTAQAAVDSALFD